MTPPVRLIAWATAAAGEIVPTFVDRLCYMVSATDPSAVNSSLIDRSRYFSFKYLIYLHDAEGTPIQTHYLTESVVAPGWPRDTPLSTKVDTKFRRQVAVDQSV
jgi:hypothetical protein